jgi:hypothetical protein
VSSATVDEFTLAAVGVSQPFWDYDRELVEVLLAEEQRLADWILWNLEAFSEALEGGDVIDGSFPLIAFLLAGYLADSRFADPLLRVIRYDFERSFCDAPFEFECEAFPVIICRILGSRCSELSGLLKDPTVSESSRLTAVSAIEYAGYRGYLSRSEAADYLIDVLKDEEGVLTSDIAGHALIALTELAVADYPELFDEVSRYSQIDPQLYSRRDYLKDLSRDPEEVLRERDKFWSMREYWSSREELHECIAGWISWSDSAPDDEELARMEEVYQEIVREDEEKRERNARRLREATAFKKREKSRARSKEAKKARRKNRSK